MSSPNQRMEGSRVRGPPTCPHSLTLEGRGAAVCQEACVLLAPLMVAAEVWGSPGWRAQPLTFLFQRDGEGPFLRSLVQAECRMHCEVSLSVGPVSIKDVGIHSFPQTLWSIYSARQLG